jgi:hypothetical protein
MKKKPEQDPSGSPKKRGRPRKESKSDNSNKQNQPAKSGETEEDFPGYPHYPASDDIMNPANDMEKTPVDIENFSRSTKPVEAIPPATANDEDLNEFPATSDLKEDDIEGSAPSEADVTEEEIKMLDSDLLNADRGEDEELRQRVYPVDMGAEDLDVPGAELDDENEALGEEDEENNPYSIGGDRHENLEEERDNGR